MELEYEKIISTNKTLYLEEYGLIKKAYPHLILQKNKKGLHIASLFYASSNISFPTAQSGHTQSDGKSSKAVPGAIPLSGSPTSGS